MCACVCLCVCVCSPAGGSGFGAGKRATEPQLVRGRGRRVRGGWLRAVECAGGVAPAARPDRVAPACLSPCTRPLPQFDWNTIIFEGPGAKTAKVHVLAAATNSRAAFLQQNRLVVTPWQNRVKLQVPARSWKAGETRQYYL